MTSLPTVRQFVDLLPKCHCSRLPRREKNKKTTPPAAATEQTGPQPSKLIALIRLSGTGACDAVSSHRFKLRACLSAGSDWAAGKHAARLCRRRTLSRCEGVKEKPENLAGESLSPPR